MIMRNHAGKFRLILFNTKVRPPQNLAFTELFFANIFANSCRVGRWHRILTVPFRATTLLMHSSALWTETPWLR